MGIVASNPYGVMDSSFFILDSLFKHTYWSVCLKYLRGTLYRSLEFCLCAVCSTTSSCLGLSALSQLRETPGLCPDCSSLLHHPETPLGSKLEELESLLHLFVISQTHYSLADVHVLKNYCFIYFIRILVVLGRKLNWSLFLMLVWSRNPQEN